MRAGSFNFSIGDISNFFYIIKINNAYTAEDSWSKDTKQYEEIKQRP
jgi:hypothetical protein